MIDSPDRSTQRRLTPKELLKLAATEHRGKLKVFLGMAPGVGKTYAMLSAAHSAKADGIDVVVGVVETHGRSETAALLEGLEVLPRQAITYRKRTLLEFDLDAALQRKPRLILIDEFAHTNAPGLIYTKRHQDVEELLRAGIDVWTTLNIQHLESLTDVVQRITGVIVRETVPDKVIEQADEIVVVDLAPEELIHRLKEGKVYLPENARRAVDQFFRPSNLTALRELALRRTADRVDEQMLSQLRQLGIEGPWPTAERLLVCVGGDPLSETVVRAAARMASALKSDWIALHINRADREITDRKTLRQVEKCMRLAERLGATLVRISAHNPASEILAYAHRSNTTQIIIGRARTSGIRSALRPSLPDRLVAKASGIAVTLVAPDRGSQTEPTIRWPEPSAALTGAGGALLAVALGVAVGLMLASITQLPNLSMVFLFAVLVCALRFGVWSAVLAAGLSFFAYNFFFIEPRYSFTIAEPHELFALLIFLVVAVVTGGLAGRIREQALATQARAEATQALYDFSRKLSGAPRLDDVITLLASQSASVVKGSAIVLLRDGGELRIVGAWPPLDDLQTSDWAAARWANEKGEPAGRLTGTMPTAQFQFRPLQSPKGTLGVVGVTPAESEDDLSFASLNALQSCIDQATIAIERTQLVDQTAKAETATESERLRVALLSSVSHDLKTPLSSIVGAATSLRQLGDRMSKADRQELAATIEEESNRLTRFVTNLLDMSKLEAESLNLRRDWADVGDAIRGATARAKTSFPSRKMEVVIEPNLPLVRSDAGLLQQVIFNLLDNAHKYSGPKSTTRVEARTISDGITIQVTDDGIGIPRDALDKVFEKFYRVEGHDGRAPGTGLGLSICAGLVKAMGGTIKAESPVKGERGTRITIVLPAGTDKDADARIGREP